MALHLLSPRLRDGIVDTLGWPALRPIQAASVPVILEGHNAVIIAPTAGGKTEAAFLPALDRLSKSRQSRLGLLYVSPLIALLNNQEDRVKRLAGLLGMDAFKWHGAVGQTSRRHFIQHPCEVLLTTPESLEAMQLGGTVPVRELFAHLQCVIIDEVHAFADSDRGAHLIAVIERLARWSACDVQRIGLSATVANPAEIGRWLKGSSRREGKVVQDRHRRQREAQLAFRPEATAQQVLHAQATRGKVLVFTEGRADAERLADSLRDEPRLDYVGTYHSAISRDGRQQAEDAMNSSEHRHVCLTCTSAMELGVDIGDLDEVVQWDPPASVSSLLQRWGRTGRRVGRPQHTTIVARTPQATLTAAALLSLANEGWVEAVRPRRRAYHILLQQMLAEAVHANRHSPASLWAALQPIPAFSQITADDYEDLLHHLVMQDILTTVRHQVTLGDRGERLFGARRFAALVTSFETPAAFTVVDVNNQFEVGQIEQLFADQLLADLADGQRPVMLLGGRPWHVRAVHPAAAVVDVVPDHSGTPPKWQGSAPRIMAHEVAGRHRDLLTGYPLPDGLDTEAQAQLTALAHQFAPTLARSGVLVRVLERNLILYTYAGTRINLLLELLLAAHGKASSDPFTVRFRASHAKKIPTVLAAVEAWAQGLPEDLVRDAVDRLKLVRLSKYQPYLPTRLQRQLVADEMLDIDATRAFLLQVGPPVPLSN